MISTLTLLRVIAGVAEYPELDEVLEARSAQYGPFPEHLNGHGETVAKEYACEILAERMFVRS